MKQYKIVVICMCILLLLAGGVYAQQKTVRILAIGNSFSQDAVEQYLHELAEAEGISTIIGNMFIGGCSLERHVKNARDKCSCLCLPENRYGWKETGKRQDVFGNGVGG